MGNKAEFSLSRRLLLLFVSLSVALFGPSCAYGAEKSVQILFLSNLHSKILPLSSKANKTTVHFGGLIHGSGILLREKAAAPDSLIINGGDAVSGLMWHSFSGEPEFSALEKAGVQAGFFGNHEFDFGADHLKKGLGHCTFPMIASNLSFDDEEMKERISRYVLLQAGKTTVGLFGLVSPNLFNQSSPGNRVHLEKDMEKIAREMVQTLLAKGAEVIVAVSSLSKEGNIALASSVEGIHAILGDFSHEEMAEGLFISGPHHWETFYAESGAYSTFIGKLLLAVENGKVSREETSWELLRVTPEAGSNPEVEKIAFLFEQKLNEALLSTLGTFEMPADGRAKSVRTGESPLGNFVADALRWRFKTDIGMVNGGGIRGDRIFPAGPVSWKLLSEIFPFGNAIHIRRLSGEQIRLILEISASTLKGGEDHIYNDNLRPPSGGFLHFSGLRAEFSLSGNSTLIDEKGEVIRWGNRVRKVSVLKDGEWSPLNEREIYTVAVNSWTAGGGDKNFIFTQGVVQKTDIRDIDAVGEYLMAQPEGKGLRPADGRLIISK